VQKSLEALNFEEHSQQSEATEPFSGVQSRPTLKIKQSLTRDFSIENLKKAAGKSQLKNSFTPRGLQLGVDSEQAARKTELKKYRQSQEPSATLQLQQMVLKNKDRLQQLESNFKNVHSQIISTRNKSFGGQQ